MEKLIKPILIFIVDLILSHYGERRTSEAEETLGWRDLRAEQLTDDDRSLIYLIEDNRVIASGQLKSMFKGGQLPYRLRVLKAYGFIEYDAANDRWSLTEKYEPHAPPPSAKTTLL